jgi:hypothetical protein
VVEAATNLIDGPEYRAGEEEYGIEEERRKRRRRKGKGEGEEKRRRAKSTNRTKVMCLGELPPILNRK